MQTVKVDDDFRITILQELRPAFAVGQELFVVLDKAGRLLLIPESRVIAILQKTAGIWEGRGDIPATGIDYVNHLRQGNRIKRLYESGVDSDGY
ncbi:MAG: hypothetical protein KJ063_15740 [Anaerolineae bacterium]|nr:hypothetical protein [Anaerolineae bacterium]